ncbi:RNA polymerase II transcription mediator complex subunit 9-domain-containing protein [Phyllosticta citrichinensis]|uniref:Mediator of RNA polymerase II transcription subunit 9 n=1 Tax=Phyllosticta citrichinensis TaxID=1130410 RepID=A0ABR1Y1Z8_9PEZI
MAAVPPSLAAAAAAANTSHTPRPSISRSAFSTPAPGTPSGAASRSYSKAPDATAANGPANSNRSAAATIPALPSPATFDLLPQLHILLSRLLIPKPAVGGSQQQQGGTSTTAPGTSATAAAGGGNAHSQQSQGTAPAEHKDPETQPLEIHQLAATASALKVRLQRARQACARLGDVDRSVEEQEDEMQELELRVAKLKAVLNELGVGGGGGGGAV